MKINGILIIERINKKLESNRLTLFIIFCFQRQRALTGLDMVYLGILKYFI